jgi:hypothetical protein
MSTKTQIHQLIQHDTNLIKSSSFTVFTGRTDRNHLQRRQQQRAINDDMIKIALTYGSKDYSYGAIRFTLTDRRLRQSPYAKMTDALRGLRVVCQPSETILQIITAYWDNHIKQSAR